MSRLLPLSAMGFNYVFLYNQIEELSHYIAEKNKKSLVNKNSSRIGEDYYKESAVRVILKFIIGYTNKFNIFPGFIG